MRMSSVLFVVGVGGGLRLGGGAAQRPRFVLVRIVRHDGGITVRQLHVHAFTRCRYL